VWSPVCQTYSGISSFSNTVVIDEKPHLCFWGDFLVSTSLQLEVPTSPATNTSSREPLDLTVNKQFKSCYDDACDDWYEMSEMNLRERIPTKAELSGIMGFCP
jgi:hypothetical protein